MCIVINIGWADFVLLEVDFVLSEVDKPVSDMGRASSVTLRVASFHSLVNVWPTMTNHLNPLQSIISGQLNLPGLIGSNVPF